MSKINLTLGILIVGVLGCFSPISAQQKEEFQFAYQANYQVTYLSDSLNEESQKQQMTELLIGDGVSLFRSHQKAAEDSSYRAYITTKVITMSIPTIIPIGEINNFNYQVVKDYSTGETKVYDEYTGSNLNNLKEIGYYLEPQEAMSNWILSEDTMTIAGYLCQRADTDFGGRKWTAWFSPEMSEYSDGPYKFRGLPGLIFRVHDAKKTWDFQLVELTKVNSAVDINFKEGLKFTKTTKEQLYKDRRDFQKNQLEISEAEGSNYGDSRASVKNTLQEYILHDNNWIELY